MAGDDDDGLFSPPAYKRYALSGKIMLGAIIVLLFVVILMICLHLYVRLHLLSSNRRQAPRRRGRRRAHFVFTAEPRHAAAAPSRGLPQSVLKSLPVFVHSSKSDPDPGYCAVCLSEFEENEIGRIIPKCEHRFHVGCIDMWFYSHVTCPLCRSEVILETGPDNPVDVSVSIPDPGIHEPVPSSESGCPPPSTVELVVASSDESISEGGLRPIDDMSVQGSSRTTANFVKSLSFKRILCRDKRDGDSPSGNAVTDTAERDLEKEETEAERSVS